MKHLGDITKINGAVVEPVEVIIGGSPCQDLSVAGKREGLSGERSGLFMEQIRIIIQGNSIDRSDTAGCNGKGVKEGVSYTLNTIDHPAVYDYDRRHDKCQGVEVAPTVTAKYGTGGGNTPLVYDARGNGEGGTVPTITGDHQNRVTDYTALAVGFPLGFRPENTREYPEKCTTICNGTRPGSCNGVITIDRAAFNQGENAQYDFKVDDEGVNSTIVSKGPSAVCSQSSVRRLTPLECERLQGYPDGWTDIGEYTDTKGKKRKTSDSARYKALGNSIALPSWAWLLERLNRYCRYHTMASLFDGIGGFPLIWETLNGDGSCIWASEIEEFPIAVTKYHFGENI